jgi:hypothetical protein
MIPRAVEIVAPPRASNNSTACLPQRIEITRLYQGFVNLRVFALWQISTRKRFVLCREQSKFYSNRLFRVVECSPASSLIPAKEKNSDEAQPQRRGRSR